jgi:hypothetical protein
VPDLSDVGRQGFGHGGVIIFDYLHFNRVVNLLAPTPPHLPFDPWTTTTPELTSGPTPEFVVDNLYPLQQHVLLFRPNCGGWCLDVWLTWFQQSQFLGCWGGPNQALWPTSMKQIRRASACGMVERFSIGCNSLFWGVGL